MNVITEKIRKGAHSFFIEQEGITGLSLPIILGVIVFFAIKYFNGSNCLFWALAAWYWLLGAFISHKKPKENATTNTSHIFERINMKLAIITMIISFAVYLSALSGIDSKKNPNNKYYYDFRHNIEL